VSNINVLIVADGIFSFGPQITDINNTLADDYFTITKFISILQGSKSPTITVTTAHREGDSNATITAPFDFSTSVPDLSVYDIIWMFGFDGTNYNLEVGGPLPGALVFISNAEISAIAEYMEGGGGVFASGDHEGLGSLMCGMLPRVGSMRAWFSAADTDPRIPAAAQRNWLGATGLRADTLQAAADGTWHFDNQSDDIPQLLSFPNGTSHPILQGAKGPISSFPDHMHEGQVILPWSYTNPLLPGDSRQEYPTVGYQEQPLILATGQTIAGHISPTEGSKCEQNNFFNEKESTNSPAFTINTLGAYDGRTMGVGRIVVDSSFHHYIDLNLIGDPCAPPGAKQQGFTTPQGAPVMADMTAFYINTISWLARLPKTCSLLMQNSTFGKDELASMGLPASFPSAFWVVMDGFLPAELGIDANGNVTNSANAPTVTFTIDPPASANANVVKYLQTLGQLQIEPFSGPVLTESLPPPPNTPQRFLYPFTVKFTGTDGFILPTELLTLNVTITVSGGQYKPKQFSASAPIELTTAANPYVTNNDVGNNYTSWLSTDLRVFRVDDDKSFFGKKVSDFYPPGTSSMPSPAQASAAATGYIAHVIKQLTPTGSANGDTFDHSLNELEDASISQLEYLQINPRSGKPAYNFAICRVRILGTTPPYPPLPYTTQAVNCRVFFRAFQAQTTVSTFDPNTTYRSTPIVTPDVSTRVPLLGVQTDATGQDEIVTIPFFAVDRVNLNGPADLTTQPADTPNVQTIVPTTGTEIDTYYGCWLDMNQPTNLFPQFAKPGDFDNKTGYFNTATYSTQSINAAFTKAPHQCIIAEIAFDDVPIPTNADTSTSDKLAQRNLAYIDGPNPGAVPSRRMPHPFQVRATAVTKQHPDELMIAWGDTPAGSTASFYLPGVAATDILALADSLYGDHLLTVEDAHTISVPTGPVSFVPIPKGIGFLAGLLTVDLPAGIKRGDHYTIVVRQLTDAAAAALPGRGKGDTNKDDTNKPAAALLSWRRVLGAFQINIPISTKEQLLLPEERQLALFRWIAENVLPRSRWYPVMQRYIAQLAGRVAGFGGNPGLILPSPDGKLPGKARVLIPVPPGDHDRPSDDRPNEITGKIDGIVYDHFGDFEGFILETRHAKLHRFNSREARVLDVIAHAYRDRILLSVIHEPGRDDIPLSVILRGPPPH
jgi:hypothetical protein